MPSKLCHKYWVTDANSVARKIISDHIKCFVCRCYIGKLDMQKMLQSDFHLHGKLFEFRLMHQLCPLFYLSTLYTLSKKSKKKPNKNLKVSHVRPDDGQIGADRQLKEALTALNVGKSLQRNSQQNAESKIHRACHTSFYLFYLMV